jgi:hypothetical protein
MISVGQVMSKSLCKIPPVVCGFGHRFSAFYRPEAPSALRHKTHIQATFFKNSAWPFFFLRILNIAGTNKNKAKNQGVHVKKHIFKVVKKKLLNAFSLSGAKFFRLRPVCP